MEQLNTEPCAGGSTGAFIFQSRPNHSLTRSQEALVFGSLAALCLATAMGFALMGYWMALPFAGLEVGALAWALRVLRRREDDYESLSIDGDLVRLEWRAGTHAERREMNRHWATVACDCRAPGRNCRLSVSSHGRATEIGQYLSDEGRLKLAATLRSRLQR